MRQPDDRNRPAAPWSRHEADETEPDWAHEIRRRRLARGDQLREIFEGFDDGDPNALLPPSTGPGADGRRER
jgi:hypothetical protein